MLNWNFELLIQKFLFRIFYIKKFLRNSNLKVLRTSLEHSKKKQIFHQKFDFFNEFPIKTCRIETNLMKSIELSGSEKVSHLFGDKLSLKIHSENLCKFSAFIYECSTAVAVGYLLQISCSNFELQKANSLYGVCLFTFF